jgi:hypothetical protein
MKLALVFRRVFDLMPECYAATTIGIKQAIAKAQGRAKT